MNMVWIRPVSFTSLILLLVFSVVLMARPVFAEAALTITAPVAGATVSKTITLQAVAAEQSGILAVQFLVDGNSVGPETGEVPYAYTLDTTQLTNGAHTIGARGRSVSGDYINAVEVPITVNNPAPLTIDNLSVVSNSATCVTVLWTTSRPTSFQLDYGLSLGFGKTVASNLLNSVHKVTLARLSPSAPY
jgi:hypothetical protein